MKCPRCQHENRPQAKFCEECAGPFKGISPTARSYADPKSEVESLRQALTEALEQQTATAEILRVISSSPTNLQPVFGAVLTSAARLCDALDATIFQVDGAELRIVAHEGPIPFTPVGALPLIRGTAAGRAVLDRRTIHVPDLQAEIGEYPESSVIARSYGFRTVLNVPLLRGAEAIGAISIRRSEVRPFTDRQIELLKTFADQAVIAIENVRLFQELQVRNRELTEALERETATGEILRVISSSPTDVQPVFETIASSAARLFSGLFVAVMRFDGGLIHLAAQRNFSEEGREAAARAFPYPPTRENPAGRVILERRALNVPDIVERADLRPALQRALGYRSYMAVPMLREDQPIGAIAVTRGEVKPFSEREVALLQTFADQAVIAIENVRLFTELQEKNRALTQAHAQVTEALEQQTATADVLKVISRSTFDLQPVLETLIESAVRLCGADKGFILRPDGDLYRPAVAYGATPEFIEIAQRNPIRAGRESATGRAVLERRVIHIPDVLADPEYSWATGQRGDEIRTILAVPMLREATVIGVIVIRRTEVQPFSDKQIELVKTFADQAVIAIENVRLFKELEARNRDLTETLEQQTATADILRVIASSPTDVQPVFDTIVDRALRLCDGLYSGVYQLDGELLRLVAHNQTGTEAEATLRSGYPRPLSREGLIGRAILERRVIHVSDVQSDPDASDWSRSRSRLLGFRSFLGVPMLREGRPIGAIRVNRSEPRPFSDREIALLRVFADQAVIAIENVRLFKELEARNRDLTEALEQQTATGEILRVIASSPTNLQPVLDAVAQNSARVCAARDAVIFRMDRDTLRVVAGYGPIPKLEPGTPDSIIPIGRDWVSGRAVVDRCPVHVHDVMNAGEEYPRGLDFARQFGHRTALATPLLREGVPLGAILIRRAQVEPFSEKQIQLLQTFAAQAVIAIENVRLFNETKEALEQQTATAEILRVIASSPTDLQPVMEAVAENAARVCGATDSSIYRIDGGHLRLVARHGSMRRAMTIGDTIAVSRGGVIGRAVVDRRTIHVEDILAAEAEFPVNVSLNRQAGSPIRTMLATPLLREGTPLGIIVIARAEVHPFSFTFTLPVRPEGTNSSGS